MLEPDAPLPDISAEEPCGPNLEFDAAFAEVERQAQGKPEQQYGSTIVPAEDPDWKEVVSGAWALLERSYDLRIMAQLAVARLQREGLKGYAETLALIRQAVETRWATVHPQLDPEDDNDPTLRSNALLGVAHPARVLRFLRAAPLARSSRAGPVSWRDIAIAQGHVEVEDEAAKLSDAVISAAFRETEPATIAMVRDSLASAVDSAVAIAASFDDQAGYGNAPDFTELTKQLRDMLRMVTAYASASANDAEGVPDDALVESGDEPPRASPGGGVSVASLRSVNSRSDAVRLLELVIEYYERNEPSSPLPLLIRRACRLADKNFLDLVRDLAPDGLGQAERIGGVSE